MRLSRLSIQRLGQLRDTTIDRLSPQLTVIYGPNEAGKSTVRDAVRYALFGFPSKNPGKSAVDARTYAGADRHVAARFMGDGGEIHLERMVDGKKLSEGSLTVSPEPAALTLRSMTEGIDAQMYHALWNVSMANLGAIDPSRDSAPVLAKLLAAEHGTTVSPTSAVTALTKEMDALFSSKPKDAPSIKTSVGRVAELRDQLRHARSQAAAMEGVRAELAAVSIEAEDVSELRRSLQADRTAIAEDIAELSRLSDESAGVVSRVRDAEEEHRIASERAAAGQSAEVGCLLALAHRAQSLELDRALVEEKRSEADRIQTSIDELTAKLDRYADVPKVLDGADSEQLVGRLDHLQRQLLRAEDDLVVARSTFEVERRRADSSHIESAGRTPAVFGPAVLALVLGLSVTVVAWLSQAGALTTVASAVATVILTGALLWKTRKTARAATPPAASAELAGAAAALGVREAAVEDARRAWIAFIENEPTLLHLTDHPAEEVVTLARQSVTRAQLESDLGVYARQLERALALRQQWDNDVAAVLVEAFEGTKVQFPSLDALVSAIRAAELEASSAMLAGEALTRLEKSLQSAREQQVRHSAVVESLLAKYGANSLQNALGVAGSKLAEIDNALAEAEERHGGLRSRVGELNHALQTAEASHDVERLGAELEMATAKLRAQTRSYVVTLLARTIIERGVEHFEGAGKPGVMESAGDVFAQLTGGAYEGVETPQGDGGEIEVVAAGGSRKSIAHLSVGTVEQLYLAIRIGALLALPDRGRDLPVLLDDVLANYDEPRSVHGYAAIAELAKGRQVLYFTCRQEVADGLVAAARQNDVDVVRVSMDGGRVL